MQVPYREHKYTRPYEPMHMQRKIVSELRSRHGRGKWIGGINRRGRRKFMRGHWTDISRHLPSQSVAEPEGRERERESRPCEALAEMAKQRSRSAIRTRTGAGLFPATFPGQLSNYTLFAFFRKLPRWSSTFLYSSAKSVPHFLGHRFYQNFMILSSK